MAAVAAETPSSAEAEAMIGAATVMVLSRRERRALQRLIPQLVRASTILTRLLRRQRHTRTVVRVIPTIVKATAAPLTRRVAAGRPLTRSVAARVLTGNTRTVLTRPTVTRAVLRRNAAVVRRAAPAVGARSRRRVRNG
jgi:hypothetical protein